MRNAGPDELQAVVKIGSRNINNLRYVDDTTLMTETKEELNNLLMRVKEESEKAGLKFNIKLRSWDPVHQFMTIEGEKVEVMTIPSSYTLKLLPKVTAAAMKLQDCFLAGKL